MKKERNLLDAYYTNSSLVKCLLKTIDGLLLKEDIILEPCAGQRNISNALINEGFKNVVTWDIDRSLKSLDAYGDSADNNFWVKQKEKLNIDWVITNPPYYQPACQQIIENSLNHCTKGIAMLLRLTYDEPCSNRAEFLKQNIMSHQIIFNPRPRFRDDCKGTDSVTTAWFVWLNRHFAEQNNIRQTDKVYITDWDKQ